MIPVAIFVRVSKGGQDYTRQVADLTAYCEQQKYTIIETISEKISGAKDNKDREGIQELLELAASKKIQKVLVTEVSRLGRKTSEILQVLEQLNDLQISVYVQNFNIETINPDGKRNPIAQTLLTFMAEFARLERETLIERIYSGLEEAKRKGVVLGRKKGSVKSTADVLAKYPHVVKQIRAGKTIRDIASICKVGTGVVQKIKKAMATSNQTEINNGSTT